MWANWCQVVLETYSENLKLLSPSTPTTRGDMRTESPGGFVLYKLNVVHWRSYCPLDVSSLWWGREGYFVFWDRLASSSRQSSYTLSRSKCWIVSMYHTWLSICSLLWCLWTSRKGSLKTFSGEALSSPRSVCSLGSCSDHLAALTFCLLPFLSFTSQVVLRNR